MTKGNVFFATPLASTQVHMNYMLSVMNAVTQLMGEGYTVHYSLSVLSDLATNRNLLCKQAIENNMDFIVFCDCDMSFETEDLYAMLEADKDCIASTCVGKKIAYDTIINATGVRLADLLAFTVKDQFVRPEGIKLKRGDIIQGTRAGTGLMVLKVSMLKKLIEQGKIKKYNTYDVSGIPSFFRFNQDSDIGIHGEDYGFCDFIRENGYNVWLHVTNQTRHYGEYGFQLGLEHGFEIALESVE